jgi:uncharacterized protein YndB with AHSA1/START domain
MTHDPARIALAACLALAAAGAHAEATGVSPSGFLVTHRLQVDATPAQVFAAIGHPERWWNGEHSWSGDAAHLSLGLHAGDCFCERWDGGSVEHARVVYVARDAAVRLDGALGPLQALAVQAVLTFGIKAVDGHTTLQVTYRVSGNPEAALDKLAGPVDAVIGEQARRLAGYAAGGTP